ncbi:MAG TPA: FliH/SctL family protein [Candidatus Elarobacter sp.]|jgi:flagellar assembly protein FliH|nr:FliH/SctL family protein [Candidatus Elarobacter sp.]
MGRVVKGSQIRIERYQLRVPEVAAPPPQTPAGAGDAHAPDAFGFGGADGGDGFLLDAPLGAAPAAEAGVDVAAVRAEAQAIIDDASRNAELLIADAHSRARTLVEDAATRADTVVQDARRQGHDDGFQAGRDAADREMNDMLVTMRGLLEMARAERHKMMEDAEPELVKLALGIAERVLHQQIALDRGVVVEMAKNAIARLIERDSVTVRVHPADLEAMRRHREELMAMGDIRNLRVVEDQRVDRGGVVVDTDAGTIDARISTQLDEARKILHIEDDIVVEPAPAGAEIVPKGEIPSARAS